MYEWYDKFLKFSWLAGITFLRETEVLKLGKNEKSICSDRYMTPAKKYWKMIIESYIIPFWFYYDVKTGIVMAWFLGKNQCIYEFKHEF